MKVKKKKRNLILILSCLLILCIFLFLKDKQSNDFLQDDIIFFKFFNLGNTKKENQEDVLTINETQKENLESIANIENRADLNKTKN